MNHDIEAAQPIQIKLERTFTGQATTLTKKILIQNKWSGVKSFSLSVCLLFKLIDEQE